MPHENMKYFLITCVLVLLKLIESDAILCYQCADSTDAKDRAPCTYDTRRMARERYLLETKWGQIQNGSHYLKNCSKYRDNSGGEKFKFCKIETVESFGTRNAYIRDCSDGITFAKLNVSRLSNPKSDNQTTCGYASLQNANQCVQLCSDQDFCNGPLSKGNIRLASLTLALICVFVSFTVMTSKI